MHCNLSNIKDFPKHIRVGLDIGSTTVKIVALDESNKVIFSHYQRHLSEVRRITSLLMENFFSFLEKKHLTNAGIYIYITGSGGMGIAENLEISFIQEVIACTDAIKETIPQTDVAIELGGEDAKITFLKGSFDQKMNGSCAGGTGAFIDQMATLLNTDATGLNEYAKSYDTIYPIAARCGVFAKTDIQPLLNEGARKENIAASVFQAVVNQTITGLAMGKKIEGSVAFLGGPLFFLSELRKRFIETLKLKPHEVVFPDDSQTFVAKGAAWHADEDNTALSLEELREKIKKLKRINISEIDTLPPLFKDNTELEAFRKRHQKAFVKTVGLENYQGNAYLGIDSGSTTLKLVLLSEKNEILYSYYATNQGKPLSRMIDVLKHLYDILPKEIKIVSSCVTGYGENLIKAALKVDHGVVETIAHYRGARHFQPDVDFILDIGGQDMKCLRVSNGEITSILLNEACSSGCGSFLETFATSLGFTIKEFAKLGLKSKHPVDLGSRCTVFMNSMVKQAQKEGVAVSDISAGLAYSVIKNTLYKVIKLKNKEEFGKNIVVQGGTFLNECVLQAFEKISEREVIRPNIAGLMGAFGAGIVAHEKCSEKTTLLTSDQLESFTYTTTLTRCGGCTNNCLLTINRFGKNDRLISGNRCEKPLGKIRKKPVPNMFDYKYHRLFDYEPLSSSRAWRGEIGIPRALNIYDSYPFWFTLLTKLGFRVILSDETSKEEYEKGISTIPSDSVCYPAKMVHGHIINLVEKGVKRIFYPCVVYEEKESKASNNHFNCPVVASYPELIKNNMDILKENFIQYLDPVISLESKTVLYKNIKEALKQFDLSKAEVKEAVDAAWAEKRAFRLDLRNKAAEIIKDLKQTGKIGIVIAGRPYHNDKEIHHGIPDLIASFDIPVLTGDAVASLSTDINDLRVVDQWTYHSRLYRVAKYIGENDCLELVELNSFGCGLDAVVTDQVKEILDKYKKTPTLLKIDEVSNLGAIKIRIRSLLAAIEYRNAKKEQLLIPKKVSAPIFTKEMTNKYTILCPQMAPFHFELLATAFQSEGYKLEILNESRSAMECGLKYINNDACYPAIIVIGELLLALKSGKYDNNKVAVILSQTGGSCRATNYIALLKKALKDAGFGNIPVLSLNAEGLEKQPGFKLGLSVLNKSMIALTYGDLLSKVVNVVKPSEINHGETISLLEDWKVKVKKNISNGSIRLFKKNTKQIVDEFAAIPIDNIPRIKVGIVGEILVKFSPFANNHLANLIEKEGGIVYASSLMGFLKYSVYSDAFFKKKFHGTFSSLKYKLTLKFFEYYSGIENAALRRHKDRFYQEALTDDLAKKTTPYLSVGNQAGEGWYLMSEMIELMDNGVDNIVCAQPFGCLPNHVTGKGMLKKLGELYPLANITPIDYDPGLSAVNQENRIKLMLSVAKRTLKAKIAEKEHEKTLRHAKITKFSDITSHSASEKTKIK
jgi:predicted CoA-substrate-specific enzyme activase